MEEVKVYTGQFSTGGFIFNGNGKLVLENGDSYEGEFREG